MRQLLLLFCLLCRTPARAQEADVKGRLEALEKKVEALAGAPARTGLSAFNPAMGVSLDTAYLNRDNDKGSFLFRSAELNLSAPIDPFLKGWVILNGAPAGVAVEEAALQTTALPWNLQVTAGRLFAALGRLAHFHDHELPVIERPRALDTFIGGETQADGVEVSVLLPTPFYLRGAAGLYNKVGGENARADNAVFRSLYESTYLGRLETSADLGDDYSLELSLAAAWTPKREMIEDVAVTGKPIAESTRKNTWRALTAVDFMVRWHPAEGGLYKGLDWGTEVLINNERRFGANKLPVDRVRSFAGFSYIQLRLGRRWRPGVMVDVSEDLDNARAVTKTVTEFLTWNATEFQRLRLAVSQQTVNVIGTATRNTVGLQWTGALGHHVHGFRDR